MFDESVCGYRAHYMCVCGGRGGNSSPDLKFRSRFRVKLRGRVKVRARFGLSKA